LAREALKNLFHPLQPFKFGLKQYASKMALKFDIGLVMYGEPWAEYGSSTVEAADVPDFQSRWYINDDPNLYIAGLPIDELKSKLSINDNDLSPYIPLRSDELKGRSLTVENLGWYIPWDPQEAYYYAVDNCGFESDDQRTDGTYGKYASIDDKFESLHYFCHFIKFGIGRTRFDASHEIRNGHLTRKEGIMLAAQYEGEFPARYHSDCLKFMDISEDEFKSITDAARSPHLWKKIGCEWKLAQELPEISALKAESGI
ncbi:N-acetyl sugar amidotransferase, partial [Alphaproteobacteria bacterium]|nr:N-acetyl sugar amidotransferase [Alphaproteobacteria bacterium]